MNRPHEFKAAGNGKQEIHGRFEFMGKPQFMVPMRVAKPWELPLIRHAGFMHGTISAKQHAAPEARAPARVGLAVLNSTSGTISKPAGGTPRHVSRLTLTSGHK
jgi:hypothetical protein